MKENPNIYKEDLVDIQLAHMDLSILSTKSEPLQTSFDVTAERLQQLVKFMKQIENYSVTLMRKGPFGITAGNNIFKATYASILCLYFDLESLNSVASLPSNLLEALRESASTLSKLNRNWLHPALYNLLRGDNSLYSVICQTLKRHGEVVALHKMFLLSCDTDI
ncbi:hypothetical protein BDF20DRAFT_490495 [Mycotypha africana]|uniref:uncharacterized protein n=1 Tax=Mycotypha africana TaxID=64632 RepID=UPI002301AE4B|nr:uncharacterized protein BDF20DRAFT_490495 [Mycotypha africana]KAI8979251.1 hypothetical protein BDF20DRAFT_490495 [Mycotypha africana]